MKALASMAAIRFAWRWMFAGLVLLVCHGCATVPSTDARDPIEGFNRGVFAFNEGLDRAVLKPAATVYRDVTPVLVRRGVGNFLSNLDDAWSFVNNVLQLKGRNAADNFFRFGVNSTFGLLGVFDVASEMQIQRHSEDFGQTLGRSGQALIWCFRFLDRRRCVMRLHCRSTWAVTSCRTRRIFRPATRCG